MSYFILRNAQIIDGTGRPPYAGHVIVMNEHILSVGSGENGALGGPTLDLRGLAVAPGFIDSHTHAEGYVLNPEASFPGKIFQGVTVEILGNCGISVFPIQPGRKEEMRAYFGPFTGSYPVSWDWGDYSSLQERMAGRPLVAHAGSLVGHGSLRIAAMGFEQRRPDAGELQKMIELLEEAFDQGAVGLSLGLMYPPGLYAELDELVALAKVAARWDRPVTSHMRNETFGLLDSVQEMLQIGEKSQAKIVISHHKAVGKANWGMVSRSLEMIDAARARGLEVYIDVYPYTAGNTMLRSLLPPWALEGGIPRMLERLQSEETRSEIRHWILERKDWENLSLAGGWDSILILSTPNRHDCEGMFIHDLAARDNQEPVDFVMDLLVEEQGQPVMLLFTASEDDLIAAMQKPYCMIGSDGIPSSGRSHPRLYGTYPRFLSRYVLEKGLMTLEEGVRRISDLPAEVYHLHDRGRIAPGKKADLVVMDIDKLKDQATYENPAQLSSGIEYLFLDGQVVVEKGIYLAEKPGKFVFPEAAER